MTEEPNTAAIRASVDRNQYAEPEDTLALCDALDAARTEEPRTGWTYRDLPHAVDSWMYYKARAEAAEARIAEATALCRRSSARIRELEAELADCKIEGLDQ